MSQQQTLQYDEFAERALLNTILTEPEFLDPINDALDVDDFGDPRHSTIFQAALELQQEGNDHDLIHIASKLRSQNLLNVVGGYPFLTELVSSESVQAYSGDPIGYAHIIRDLSMRRKMRELAEMTTTNSHIEAGMTAEEALGYTEEAILALINADKSNDNPENASDIFNQMEDFIEEASQMEEGATIGIPTGFPALDDLTGGYKPGELIIIAARPSVGKTVLAIDMARAAAYKAEKSVLFFNLEMTPVDFLIRITAAEGDILQHNLKKGRLTPEEYDSMQVVKERIQQGNLFIDSPVRKKVDLAHVRSRALRQKHSAVGLDMIVIDYLGLMEVSSSNKNYNRQNEIQILSRGLKLLARELNIPIIILSQLNRSSESRVDKEPQIADLRESGSLEQDADIVLLIHRPDQLDKNIRPGEADLILAKNRGGSTTRFALLPMLEYGKYIQGDGEYPVDTSLYDSPDTLLEDVKYPPPSEEDKAPF